jgi:predicted amidohydrolase
MSTLNFTLIQSNLIWEDKTANLQNFATQIDALITKTQVALLPEMFSTGFSMNAPALAETMNGESVQWMKNIAAKHKIIIAGSLIIVEDGKYYNRFIWMQPNGVAFHYDKRHCFSLAGEDEHFTPGNKKIIVQANGVKICLQVCYDLRFPVFSRQTKDNEYDVLVYVANWPARRQYAWQHLLIARAIENQCYVIGINRVGTDANNLEYNGLSSIINPLGEVQEKLIDKEGTISYTIDTTSINEIRKNLPFLNDADEFKIL